MPVVVSLDRECRTVVGNRRACESLPVPFRIMQKGVEVPPENLPMQLSAATRRDVLDFSCQFVSGQGIARHMLCHAVPLLDNCGRARGSVATFTDVTALNQFEGQLWDAARLEGLRLLARNTAGEFLTTVSVDISLALDDFLPRAHGVRLTASESAPLPGAKGVVLIVDDESSIRGLIAAILKTRKIRFIEASSGEQAIQQVKTHGASIRVVILDLTIPGMSGDEALPTLLALLPGVPMIVSSGYSEADVSRHFDGSVFESFLPKPYSVDQLLEKVLPAFDPALAG